MFIKEPKLKGDLEVYLARKKKKGYRLGSVYSRTDLGSVGCRSFASSESERSCSTGSGSSDADGSGAVLVHSKKRGDRHPTKDFDGFMARVNGAMADLNDPDKARQITEAYKLSRDTNSVVNKL